MQAVVLAGGKGARLKPYTTEIPKPLVPLGDKPVIEILLAGLKKHGANDVVICVNHLAHLISSVLEDGERFGLNIRYSLEKEPLSTVAPLKLIENLQDNFLVANGDILTDLDFNKLYQHHLESEAGLTVATHQRRHKVDYGVIGTGDDNRVVAFEEKPTAEFTVSMGIYVFSKRILDLVPDGAPFGFDDLMYLLLEKNEPVGTFPFDGYWMDIGRPDDYEQAKEDIKSNPDLLAP
ncbi:MAG: NTP transferase domain-containing protein [Candidatus Zixiibacteriota bacterium]|nr:MAG: NTP transferase domain-containing protein [candidate division Zixibacteria bacterium]